MAEVAVNFDWVTPNLAIGGCPAAVLDTLARDHAVGAVVDLREETCDDRAALASAGIAFLHLPTPDHHAIVPGALAKGVAFGGTHLRGGRRVLVHCQHGIGRSALLVLCLLCEEGWPPLDALARLKAARPLVSPSPPQYEAWAGWLRANGSTPPHFDAFAAIAYGAKRA